MLITLYKKIRVIIGSNIPNNIILILLPTIPPLYKAATIKGANNKDKNLSISFLNKVELNNI